MSLKNLFSLIFVASVFFACNQDPEKKQEVVTQKQPVKDSVVKEVKVVSNPFNDVSSIISGISDSTNKLSYLYDSVAWNENRTFINASWEKLKANRLNAMEAWGKKELVNSAKNCKTVFYPFSGPDFLTSDAFYPDAEEMVMLGLEPVGGLPEIDAFTNEMAKDYTNDFQRSLTDIFEKSYFITQYMLRDFQKQKVNGTLPVLSFFIKKTGHQILDIKYLVRQAQDSILEMDYHTAKNPFGVKIVCERNGITKNIYYFKYDVSNKQFNDTCVFYKFINEHTRNSVTYLKSASYLLHANFMSNMRDLILKNSNYVLEDDTGIPYSYFEEGGKWNVQLYGQYAKPVKNFPYLRMQKGILKAFEKDSANIPEIPFHLGYHWENKKDLLIYATKKENN